MAHPVSPQDPWVQVAEVARLIRNGTAQTRPELADATRLGRNVITQRIRTAQEVGLVRPSGEQRSRGGRAAEVWEFDAEQGRLVLAILSPEGVRVAVTDLLGRVVDERRVDEPPSADVLATCELIAAQMDDLLAVHLPYGPAWGIGISVPIPVDVVTGRGVGPVAAGAPAAVWPGAVDVRSWFTRRMKAPVWLDSSANLAARGSVMPGSTQDLVFVRLDHQVSSGIVSQGRPHHGTRWIAGQIGHITVSDDPERICLCGRVGCLETFAARWAIEAGAEQALRSGRSAHLSSLTAPPRLEDVVRGAQTGDPTCTELVLRAADAVGRALAAVVTWYNPGRVVIGGGALAANSLFQGAAARSFHTHVLAASAEGLDLTFGDPAGAEEVIGAAAMVTEALTAPEYLAEWGPGGFPIDVEILLAKHEGRSEA